MIKPILIHNHLLWIRIGLMCFDHQIISLLMRRRKTIGGIITKDHDWYDVYGGLRRSALVTEACQSPSRQITPDRPHQQCSMIMMIMIMISLSTPTPSPSSLALQVITREHERCKSQVVLPNSCPLPTCCWKRVKVTWENLTMLPKSCLLPFIPSDV